MSEELCEELCEELSRLLECANNPLCTLETFNVVLKQIEPKMLNSVFDQEYTLLIYLCSKSHMYVDKDDFKEKLVALITAGADINQIVGGKTALGLLVTTDKNIDLVKDLINNFDANPMLGNLPFKAINAMSEEVYKEREAYTEDPVYFSLPEHHKFFNYKMFEYLCSLELDINKVDPVTGMTPLIAICSADDVYRFHILTEKFSGLFKLDCHTKSRHGISALDWANRHCSYLACLLEDFIKTQKHDLKEVIYQARVDAINQNQTLLFDIGFQRQRVKDVIGQFLLP